MGLSGRPDVYPGSVAGRLGGPEAVLLHDLYRFTEQRLAEAASRRDACIDAADCGDSGRAQAELHAFLHGCWEALDGVAREANLVLHGLLPETGLYPPLAMTRQCTFYMVRKKLREHPATAEHPVSRLLWERTRQSPAAAYERLSFLHNISLFLPVPLLGGCRLPGTTDVPDHARGIVKTAAVGACPAREGLAGMADWVHALVAECRRELRRAADEGRPEGTGVTR
jgi:hypothetical protein